MQGHFMTHLNEGGWVKKKKPPKAKDGLPAGKGKQLAMELKPQTLHAWDQDIIIGTPWLFRVQMEVPQPSI